jgi:hypothetical protein
MLSFIAASKIYGSTTVFDYFVLIANLLTAAILLGVAIYNTRNFMKHLLRKVKNIKVAPLNHDATL